MQTPDSDSVICQAPHSLSLTADVLICLLSALSGSRRKIRSNQCRNAHAKQDRLPAQMSCRQIDAGEHDKHCEKLQIRTRRSRSLIPIVPLVMIPSAPFWTRTHFTSSSV